MRSVGVMGDERTYDYTVALRAVTTTDFMTGEWARIPYDVLDTVSRRIVNEVKHVNRKADVKMRMDHHKNVQQIFNKFQHYTRRESL